VKKVKVSLLTLGLIIMSALVSQPARAETFAQILERAQSYQQAQSPTVQSQNPQNRVYGAPLQQPSGSGVQPVSQADLNGQSKQLRVIADSSGPVPSAQSVNSVPGVEVPDSTTLPADKASPYFMWAALGLGALVMLTLISKLANRSRTTFE
jgi:hypothetical protein